MSYRKACALLISLVLPSMAAFADAARCRSAVTNASAQLAQQRLAALTQCEEKVVSGASPAGTYCEADPIVLEQIAHADAQMRDQIATSCGGNDRTSSASGDDGPLPG